MILLSTSALLLERAEECNFLALYVQITADESSFIVSMDDEFGQSMRHAAPSVRSGLQNCRPPSQPASGTARLQLLRHAPSATGLTHANAGTRPPQDDVLDSLSPVCLMRIGSGMTPARRPDAGLILGSLADTAETVGAYASRAQGVLEQRSGGPAPWYGISGYFASCSRGTWFCSGR